MKKMKRSLSMLVAVVMLCAVGFINMDANAATDDQTLKAKALSEMGLFRGYDTTGNNFGLDDTLTREQALALLIRMKSEDTSALAWKGSVPYTDVSESHSMLPYVGYAKNKGYTKGIGDGQFGMGRTVGTQEMTAFALRSLGYTDTGSDIDFTWNDTLRVGKEKGILTSSKAITPFTRGNAVDILFNTLAVDVKGQDYDLLSKLIQDGTVTQTQYDKAMLILNPPKKIAVTGLSLNQSTAKVQVDATVKLTAKISPTNATNKDIIWSTGNASIASVDQNGLVRGEKTGTTTITVKTMGGSKSAKCTITVTAKPSDLPARTKALSKRYDTAVDRYNKLLADCKKLGLTKDSAFVASVNELTTEINKMGKAFNGYTLTEAKITEFTSNLNDLDSFMAEMDTLIKNATTTNAAANSKKAIDRYNAAVTAYNALLAEVPALGLDKNKEFVAAINPLTDEISKMSDQITAATKDGTPLTASQISACNITSKAVEDFVPTFKKLIADAKAAAKKPATRTIHVKFVNNTTADFINFKAFTTGSSSIPEKLSTGATTTFDFTVESSATPFTVSFIENLSKTPYTLPFTFDASLKDGATLTVTFDVEKGNIVYEDVVS